LRRHRGILAVLTLLALAAASAGSGWYYFLYQLPHPRDANKSQLFRWLVQREIADEPYEIQVALIDRLEAELPEAAELDDATSELDGHQREQLSRNFRQLKRVWFTTRAARFAACPENQRANFLARQLRTIHSVSAIMAQDGASSPSLISRFFDDIQGWMEEAGADQRQGMVEVVEAAVIHWLATGDLETQPFETRRELANRIAHALDKRSRAFTPNGIVDSDERQSVLRSNSLLLFEAWFLDRAAEYESLSADNRDQFVAEQIKRVYRWGVLDFLMQTNGESSPDPPSGLLGIMRLAKLVNTWIERAEEPDRTRMRNLFTHVQRQLISGAVELPPPAH